MGEKENRSGSSKPDAAVALARPRVNPGLIMGLGWTGVGGVEELGGKGGKLWLLGEGLGTPDQVIGNACSGKESARAEQACTAG